MSVLAAESIFRPTADLDARFTRLTERLRTARQEIESVVFGQTTTVDLCLIALLSGGHFLLMGLPGLGKTTLVETLSKVLGLDARRLQCTPDLMPADVTGTEILNTDTAGERGFRFIKGPVFCQLLMADEINRASPRTQSALLQAMQEHQVSIGGITHDLPRPFHVMATQNPLEQEGTYPLPEAQLDRFLLRIDVDYPKPDDERRILLATTGPSQVTAKTVFEAQDILAAQHLVRELPMGQSVVDGILRLVQAGRPTQSSLAHVKKYVSWGPGPRAGQALMLAVRARALLDQRYAPSLDDVIALAPAVLKHRMDLHFSARAAGVSLDQIVDEMCQATLS